MSQLQRAGQSGAIDVATSQAAAKQQLATLVDMMRQVAGNAVVLPGSGGPMDPLSAPFTLYVNPYIGSDKFIGGSYNTHEATGSDEEIIAQKLKRVELQRLECGYTPQRPFKTINRAVIEAAIITSKNWYTYTDPRAHVDCVSIVLSPGVHILLTNEGSSSTSLASWGTSKDPTDNDLIQFNPVTGGVLLPRGCSLCGPDLRKVTIRPTWVPANAPEAADYSNRRGMLKITGTGYFFGFTVMDKIGWNQSHHLLDAFHFGSKSELDAFYAKCRSAVGTGADLSNALTVTRGTEYQIVGPIDQTQAPTSAWDTTASASPYIFNCSVRSDYGLGGAFMDGAKVEGLKSMVCANFTGVSLQKDMSCWQRHNGTTWTTTTYQQYIDADPDNIRMDPTRLSRHISAINDAFIQEVSVFAIGHGVHHFTDRGGEITVTNSNSSFGGVAAYSKGYKNLAFPVDRNWSISGIKVPLGVQYKAGNIRFIYLGTTEAVTPSTVTLSVPLAVDSTSQTVPAQLLADGYSLRANTRIWIENPQGDPWSAVLTSTAWDANTPDRINITAEFTGSSPTTIQSEDEDGNTITINALLNKRIYIRRLVDTRTPAERRMMLLANNTASARLPQRNFIIQTDPARTNGAVSGLFNATNQVFAVSTVGIGSDNTVATSSEFTLRTCATDRQYTPGEFYPAGTTVRTATGGKHITATRDVLSAPSVPDSAWVESYVHTASAYVAEDPIKQEGRIITIDTDTHADPYSTTLNINWTTELTTQTTTRNQYRSSTDYRGAYQFLRALGFSESAAHAALLPQAEDDRLRDPASAVDFPIAPAGGAASSRGNWAVEFRRPSVLRLYGHAWEWAGFLNYSKAIPAAQKDLSPQNLFTYYFTNEGGGRVVPQGSNENGFNVTPQGLEDIETGTTLSVENVGSSQIDQATQTSFQNLTVDSLTVENLTVTTSALLPDIGTATTTKIGPVGLANAELLRGQATLSGNTDNERNASINADAENAVTIKGLNYWRIQNRLLTARSGVQRIYVDPNNESNSTLNQLLSDPPLTPDKAVRSLARAAEYANESFGPTTIVEFMCRAGVYKWDSGTIVFKTVARIRAWNNTSLSGSAAYLNDSKDGPRNADGPLPNVTPFNYGNFYDSTKQPVFLTRITASIDSAANCITTARPLQLRFEQAAEVTGVCWWGVMTTITKLDTLSNPVVPDTYFPGSTVLTAADSTVGLNWRAQAIADPDNALNYFIREHAVKAPADGKYYGHRIAPAMEFLQTGRIANVAIGALSPAEPQLPGNQEVFHTVIRCSSKLISVSGLSLVGNCKISSEKNLDVPNDKDYSIIRLRFGSAGNYSAATYFYNGWAISLFGSLIDESSRISLVFGTSGPQFEYTGANGSADYNQVWNNVNLLNNSLQVATSTAVPTGTGWTTIGPALFSVIGLIRGTAGYNERNWTTFRIAPGNTRSGFNGKFGLAARASGSNTKTIGSRIMRILESFGYEGDSTEQTIFQVAGSGAMPTINVSGLTFGQVSALQDFDELNMQVYSFKKGVDTAEATNYERDFVL
jgi:hypothetical protein